MAFEIERKFLVQDLNSALVGQVGTSFSQAYLNQSPERTVRVRIEGDLAKLTIKGQNDGIRRLEFEYSIPKADAQELLVMCIQPVIQKIRYKITVGQHIYEVDCFSGVNEGLVVAEVELQSEEEAFERPPWLGTEVSGLKRYFNSRLAAYPYSKWSSEEKST